MFSIVLKCPRCAFCSDEFVSGYNGQSDSLALLYQRESTGLLRVVNVKDYDNRIQFESGDEAKAQERAVREYLLDGEICVDVFLKKEADAFCPICKARPLNIECTGIV